MTAARSQDLTTEPLPPSDASAAEPKSKSAVDRWADELLAQQGGTPPVGSRRRRMALLTSQNIPFEQLPYQCFQEARKILAADREEKIAQIAKEVEKIRRLEALDADKVNGGEKGKQQRIAMMRMEVEKLKILADINDPLVKRRFEDGLGTSYPDPRASYSRTEAGTMWELCR
jgi:large subunit ribosomal protein L35